MEINYVVRTEITFGVRRDSAGRLIDPATALQALQSIQFFTAKKIGRCRTYTSHRTMSDDLEGETCYTLVGLMYRDAVKQIVQKIRDLLNVGRIEVSIFDDGICKTFDA